MLAMRVWLIGNLERFSKASLSRLLSLAVENTTLFIPFILSEGTVADPTPMRRILSTCARMASGLVHSMLNIRTYSEFRVM